MSKQNTKNIFIEKAMLIHGSKYDYSLVEYKNNYTKVKIICIEHGEFEQRPDNHLTGQRCGKCYGKNRKTSDFILEANKIHKNKYDYSESIYNNSFEKIKIICKIHGVFEQISTNHINNRHRCPTCNKSNGELLIKEYLDNKEINYITQKRFAKCRDIRELPFDFYLPDTNICIEYDGIQHFKAFKIWGGEIGLLNRQKKDKIKNNFCEDNKIKLIRIAYNEKIEDKLLTENVR